MPEHKLHLSKYFDLCSSQILDLSAGKSESQKHNVPVFQLIHKHQQIQYSILK